MPFDCNGRSYRVLATIGGGTYLQEIHQNRTDKTVSFTDLHFFKDYEINAIAYHPSQNVIYGVLQTPPYRLCRIDAEYNLEILQTLPLSSDLVFVSGDISPDEQHLVLFGFGNTRNENIFALVDVQDGNYETEIIPMQTNNPEEESIYCADIAFHPTTGKLFGFDFRHDRLVTLDITNRIIDNEVYPHATLVTGNIPSIFFDAKGELYGIGATTQDSSHHRAYYKFDLATGQGVTLEELDVERNQDACSCPYRIKVLNEVRERRNAPCTELAFEITLINKTDTEQFDLVLRDTFPLGISIEKISELPIDAVIESGIGSNILSIKSMHLPIGTYSFDIILEIDENTNPDDYENQAVLSGIRLEEFELNSVRSDDPLTAVAEDATRFSVDALNTPFEDDFFGICDGGEITLHTGIYGANTYEWSSGEKTEEITVNADGYYEVTVTTDCDQTIGTAKVTMDEISLDLGHDQTLESGQAVILKPNYTSHSPIKSFNWQTDNSDDLDCPTCENPMVQPQSDAEVFLMMENITGCQIEDQLYLRVADIKLYTPNVFSPNSNDDNNMFYLQGNLPYDIAEFKIFDRWGSVLYDKKNITTNLSTVGWDGTLNGKELSTGIYIWKAVMKYKNGQRTVLSGNVTLVR